jgi:hypothetical protein
VDSNDEIGTIAVGGQVTDPLDCLVDWDADVGLKGVFGALLLRHKVDDR